MKYILHTRNSSGILGEVKTKHGNLKTPLFISCATKGAIKGANNLQMMNANTQMILSNTVHLLPYSEHIKNLGGLHKFMNWSKPLLTDSGGFQMFSWSHGGVVDEIKGVKKNRTNRVKFFNEGAEFTYPNSNQKILLTPSLSMQTQINLGVDFCVALDECTASSLDYYATRSALHRSHEWELESLKYFQQHAQSHQRLLGIVQGGIYEDLRKISCGFVMHNDFWGYCIGGSLGRSKEDMYHIVKYTCSLLNNENKKYIHLLGIGETADILNLVPYGIDSFDCVHATRIGRHGCGLLSYFQKGKDFINLNNTQFKDDLRPIDETCRCSSCKYYSRAYIHYLLSIKEINAITAIVEHNVFRMNRLMIEIREAIANNNLPALKEKWLSSRD